MMNDQEFQELYESMTKFEEELTPILEQPANNNWEAKVIEQFDCGEIHSAISIYREYGNRQANLLEAVSHIMEIKRKTVGKREPST